MSYARWSEHSDVYVYLSGGRVLVCHGCAFMNGASFIARSTGALVVHLRDHVAAGHGVPQRTFEQLEDDRSENDAFIRGEVDERAD